MAPKKPSPKQSQERSGRRSGKGARRPEAVALAAAVPFDDAAARARPLPLQAGPTGSSGGAGADASVLIVGGTAYDAGALVLASTAALRAGAAVLEVATARPLVALVTALVPQARGLGLDARRSGAIAAASSRRVAERASRVRVLLLGPGMRDGREAERFVGRVVARLDPKKGPSLVLDGELVGVLSRFPDLLRPLAGRAILVARTSQLASLTRALGAKGESDALTMARAAAKEWKGVVACTDSDGGGFAVSADGAAVTIAGTLASPLRIAGAAAGLIAAFAARGASPFDAASWGLLVRARAIARVTATVGHHGFLATEMLAEVPAELEALGSG